MHRLIQSLVLALLLATGLMAQGVSITRAVNYPTDDTVAIGMNNIRGIAVGNDIDGDGMKEIAVTNYLKRGVIHILEVVGNDSLALRWTSPLLDSLGGGSTPRSVIFADLDGDGKGEVITQISNWGVLAFEWDGVTGSDNYGTGFSGVLDAALMGAGAAAGSIDHIAVDDVDADGKQELLLAYNGTPNANDKYYIVNVDGDWATNDPGFSSFVIEYSYSRTDASAATWGLASGTPVALIPAQFDGTGPKDILVHNWDNKNVTILRSTGANNYALADATNGKTNVKLGAGTDDVGLFGGLVVDIDGDGRQEVYLTTWATPAEGPGAGKIHMVHYESGQDVDEIDSTNFSTLDITSVSAGAHTLGFGWGDIDGNGKRNIYVTAGGAAQIVSMEYQGGDKTNQANWIMSALYGDTAIYKQYDIKDSLGTVDTTFTKSGAFVTKIHAANDDLDGDGYQDIVIPYQIYNDADSIVVKTSTWNGSSYDLDSTKIINPRRWSIRVLEGSVTVTGVESKEWTLITPDDYRLEQNFPNPFNPSTTIRYSLPLHERISLRVYDVNGRLVRTLLNNVDAPAGAGEVVWNGTNDAGQTVSSGAYFYTLSWGNFTKSQKMTMVK